MSKQNIADKQYLAKILYTREKLEQKIIAKKVGVSEVTVSKWVTKFGWKKLRSRMLIGKEEVLSNLYDQISELNEDIKTKNEGKRYGDSRQADTLIKYTAAIRNLETELAIADLVESGIRFIRYLQKIAPLQTVVDISDHWNGFLQEAVKK